MKSSLNMSRRQFGLLAAAGVASTALPMGSAFAQTRGGTIVAPLNQDPTSIVPAFGTSNVIQTVGGKLFPGLFNLDSDKKIVPALAEAVELSEDGLQYTFKLRQGVTWHDGKPFTADDVLFSLEVVPQFVTRTGNALKKVAETIKVDDYTVVLKLTKPYLPFTLATSGINLPMIPKHIYEGSADYLTHPANNAPIGTGPYKFKEWKKGEYIHFVRNEEYFLDDLPYADEIYFTIVPDASQRSISAETGQANLLVAYQINEMDQQRFLQSGAFKLIEGAYDGVGSTVKMNVNQRHPLLGDKRFRQALTHAINRQQITDNVYGGVGRVMNGPIATATAYYDQSAVKVYDYDPAKANALLDEMGLKRDANGIRTSITITVPSTSAGLMRTQELVRLNLSEVGIDTVLDVLDIPAYTKKDADWAYDLLLIGPGQFLDPDLGVARFLLTSNIKNAYQANTGGYSNPQVDELWAKAVAATAREEAQAHYTEIQKILTEDVPDIWLVENDQRLLAAANMNGFSGSPQEGYAEWDRVHFA